MDNGYDDYDPRLSDFVPPNLKTCSNIQDNPIHETLQDKLIGVQHIVFTRRAKFLSVSLLTSDYIDTNGYLQAVEGQLETGDLISLITVMGDIGPQPEDLGSTFIPPVRSSYSTELDYKTRFMQYVRTHNDRASYSLACILDGDCPVNFRDQINKFK